MAGIERCSGAFPTGRPSITIVAPGGVDSTNRINSSGGDGVSAGTVDGETCTTAGGGVATTVADRGFSGSGAGASAIAGATAAAVGGAFFSVVVQPDENSRHRTGDSRPIVARRRAAAMGRWQAPIKA